MSASSTITEADMLADIVGPAEPGLSRALAESILALKFNSEAHDRMGDLLDRNNKGTLTDAEQDELERWRRVGMFLDLMQAKARESLAP